MNTDQGGPSGENKLHDVFKKAIAAEQEAQKIYKEAL